LRRCSQQSIESLWRDFRFAARALRKNPGFTLAAVLTCALGTGGNTAVFTVVSAVFLRPLPYRDPQTLALIEVKRKESNTEEDHGFSLGRYELIRDRSHEFAAVAAVTNDTANLTGRGEPQQVPIARVTANFFSVLGITPEAGRTFTADEARPEGKPVVLISHWLWLSRFGKDVRIIGQTVNIDSTPCNVIGVVPGNVSFPFMGPADVWSPRYFELSMLTPQHIRSGVGYLTVVARAPARRLD
jgi:hypothetical protein